MRREFFYRTQYTVLMYDTTETNSKPWNITFFDYNSHTMAPEILDKYEFIHVTSSTTGKIVTMSKKNNNFLWQLTDDTYKSPIVAIFILSSEGFLSVPFTTVSGNVIEKVIDYSLSETKSDFQL
jgi:serine/threonine-protein kinase/endoribonuclease IRE1